MSLGDLPPVPVIAVDDADPALPEQHRLARKILLKGRVLIRRDVIRLEVGEYAVIKHKPLCPVHFEPLRRRLHHDHLAACILHLPEISLQCGGFRRRVRRGDHFVPYDRLDRPDKPDLIASLLQYVFDEICRRRLSLCACHTDDLHAVSRISIKVRRYKRHRIPGVRNPDHSDLGPVPKLHLMIDHQHRRAFAHRLCHRRMPVKLCAVYAYKKTALCNLSGVIYHLRYRDIRAALDALVFKSPQQIPTLKHITHSPLCSFSCIPSLLYSLYSNSANPILERV